MRKPDLHPECTFKVDRAKLIEKLQKNIDNLKLSPSPPSFAMSSGRPDIFAAPHVVGKAPQKLSARWIVRLCHFFPNSKFRRIFFVAGGEETKLKVK